MSESLEALRNEMFETMQRMRQRRSTPPLPPGITRGEINALMMLSMMEARDEIARPGMLAACSHATPGAVSQTLKSLEEKGLIVRRRGEGDSRSVTISLTDAAIKDGRYDAKGRENLLNLFDKDFEGTKAMLAAIPCRANVAGQINTDKGSGVTLGDWKDKSWDELDKAGKLVELKDAAPDLYKSKFKERFGIEPNL